MSAGFHHDEIDVFQAKHVLDMNAPSLDGLKSVRMISKIVEASDGVELAEVHRNDHHGIVSWFEVSMRENA